MGRRSCLTRSTHAEGALVRITMVPQSRAARLRRGLLIVCAGLLVTGCAGPRTSANPKTSAMPNVVGMTVSQTRDSLEASGLQVQLVFPGSVATLPPSSQKPTYSTSSRKLWLAPLKNVNDTAAPHRVLSQSLPPGSPIHAGERVALTMSAHTLLGGSWVSTPHAEAVINGNISRCLGCHQEPECSGCHVLLAPR